MTQRSSNSDVRRITIFSQRFGFFETNRTNDALVNRGNLPGTNTEPGLSSNAKAIGCAETSRASENDLVSWGQGFSSLHY